MIVVKTDGIIPTGPAHIAALAASGARLVEPTCLTEEAMIEHCAGADALLVLREPVTARVIAAMPNCRVITRFGIGVDTVDVAAAAAAGIIVTNVPDANIEEVSIHAIAMALSLSRRLPGYDAGVRAGQWDTLARGRGIQRPAAQCFGVIGLGRIGSLVARRARALGFKVLAHEPSSVTVEGVERLDLATLIERSDILSLHIPLTSATRNLIDARAIARMKPGAILINVARGGLVDETALAQALTDGHLAGAGLDTFDQEPLPADSPLRHAPNLIMSPHAAHFSAQSFAELVGKAFDDVARVLAGRPPVYPVTSPLPG
ncbi:C-terminal binding protein [Novosphingobium sp. FSW06-99]|uniref:C-terminal binding protein n=1 Tax=Novosphingobium sp. FSW06-99 TaxID=1739113 RepID=UPI0009EADCEB|nr:C-terminal binding protein [Novosphingobium sp. FSW06-99]